MIKRSALASAGLALGATALEEHQKFVIASTPQRNAVFYLPVGESDFRPLLDGTNFKKPEGIAVDQKGYLYIADPLAEKVLRYKLTANGKTLTATDQVTVADYNSRWVAVNGVGTVLLTSQENNEIVKVTSPQINAGDKTPTMLYHGSNTPQVSSPAGIVSDNFYVYFTNLDNGAEAGTVVAALENAPDRVGLTADAAVMASPLSDVADQAYGVCAAGQGNLFFLGQTKYIWGVKSDGGGETVMISDKLAAGRDCAWDGGGTAYVSDRDGGWVYSFPSNMDNLHGSGLTQVARLQDAFGLAVYQSGVVDNLMTILAFVLPCLMLV